MVATVMVLVVVMVMVTVVRVVDVGALLL